MVKDPMCGMEVNVKKEKYFFCCKECKEDFLKKPFAYPNHCAKCMKKCDLKETIWKIKHKGKLYCFCSKGCKEKFQKEYFGEIVY